MTPNTPDLRDLMRSAARFSWAMSLFGAQQAADTLDRDPRAGASRMDRLERALGQALNEPVRTLYRSAEAVRQRMAEAGATADGLTARGLMKLGLEIAAQSAQAFQALTPGRGGQLAWQEFQNKLQAFTLFEHADAILNLADLEQRGHALEAAKAAGLDAYETLWAMEGAGHYYAGLALRAGAPRASLGPEGGELPRAVRIPFHAGFGLALANALLAATPAGPPAHWFSQAVRGYLESCDAAAAPGYAGICYEALGFSARSLYPHLLGGLAAAMGRVDPELEEYFWHGAGRAAYFAPSNALPVIPLSAGLRMCEEEAPHETARLNLLAGFCWAFTLVNLQHPDLLDHLLARLDGRHTAALHDGAGAALLVWSECAPEDDAVASAWRARLPAPESIPERPGDWFRFRAVRARSRTAACVI